MIDIGMYAALGFLIASLLALMLAPPLWKRAVRLTTRRLESTMPMSAADIRADKDQLRAEFAIELRRVEVARDKAKDKAARELIEANKRRVEVAEVNAELGTVQGRLQEKENANRVLEQTIRRRLPELEGRLKVAKEAIAALETQNTELRNSAGSQAEALKLARSTVNTQRGDIDQLRGALDVGAESSRRSKSDSSLAKENRKLSAELSKLKEELIHGKIGGKENDLLRQELNTLAKQILVMSKAQGVALPEPAPLVVRTPSITERALAERDTAFIAKREESLAETPRAAPQSGLAALAGHDNDETDADAPDDDAEHLDGEHLDAERLDAKHDAKHLDAEEAAPQGSLAKILAARKARRRGGRGRRGGSLSERLKNVSAEASDS
jgi:predicted  nucleic acid-binding Zn-ribbon protein